MNFDVLLPITLIIGIVYAIRIVVDNRFRRHLVNSAASRDMIESLLRHEERSQRLSALRWSIVLLALALGFAIVEANHWQEITPGFIAVLLGATGLGNLVFWVISRRMAVSRDPGTS